MTPSDADNESVSTTDRASERITEEAERAVDMFDTGIVDVLAWLLDTETRARIYIYLRANPDSTSDEIAEGTGLYPSTVRESLTALHDDDIVTREKRSTDTAGNNPYIYTAIAPSELIGDIATEIQDQLNTVCNLDQRLAGDADPDAEPIQIEVTDEADDE